MSRMAMRQKFGCSVQRQGRKESVKIEECRLDFLTHFGECDILISRKEKGEEWHYEA